MHELDIRTWEFGERLKALDDELSAWIRDTKQIQQLRRHHSQVQAFAEMLALIRRSIEPTAERPIADLSDARERSKVVLGSFRIWEFLRAKLAQRREVRFGPFLWLADEYAWLCYQPIYRHGLKEPPLVYLNGGYSPFTLTRQDAIEAESVPQELLRSRSLLEAMESLPFPVIGVPWYQIRNLADLPVVGHEVGHSVEADLRLTKSIEDAINAAVGDLSRRARWNAWGSEIFADLYGTIACGAAFVSALANFLATEDQAEETEDYPPVAIRLRFNVEVLRALGFATDADKLSERWNKVFPVPTDLTAYEPDAGHVAVALLDGITAAGKKIRDWMPFAAACERARLLAKNALNKYAIDRAEPFRALVAAYRFAYDEVLDSYEAPKLAAYLPRLERLKTAMIAGLVPDLRVGEPRAAETEAAARSAAHSQRAAVWLDALRH